MHTLVQGEHLYRQPSISIEEIAHRMSVNKTYLSRAINNCTGNNFKAYINEYRIKFKKLTGLSPSDFRNNLHQVNPASSE
jgi:YesN/AraC family two-component response regulator